MPIYEYVCKNCSKKYDKFVRSQSSKVQLKCPNCGSERGEKAFSAFSTGQSFNNIGGGISSAPACGPVG